MPASGHDDDPPSWPSPGVILRAADRVQLYGGVHCWEIFVRHLP
jgi:hypothetical protein